VDSILQGIAEGLRLIFTGDPRTWEVALRSLEVSLSALAIALVLGVPIGAAVGLSAFRGRRLVVATLNTGMGMPRVVVGLVIALFLWRTGPLGDLGLMYTVQGMIIAQTFIATPIIAALCVAALQQLDPGFRLQVMSLGAGRLRTFALLMREIKGPLMAATAAAFGGIIAEVGAVMMVGGNIRGQTEVLTTGIVANVNMGLFGSAIALAVVLLILSFSTNLAMILLQRPQRRKKDADAARLQVEKVKLSGSS
jgi:tungstate transport system permease protein